MRSRLLGIALTAFFSAPAAAQPVNERLSTCLACHGANGQSENPVTPSLGGQPEAYLLIQLFTFREKIRIVEPMNEQTKGMSDDDLRVFSATLAKLPKPKPAEGSFDTARLERVQSIVARNRCNVCHNADFSGQEQLPRLAAQREDYLLKSMRDYKSGARLGYDPAMLEVMRSVSDEDIVELAAFLSRLP